MNTAEERGSLLLHFLEIVILNNGYEANYLELCPSWISLKTADDVEMTQIRLSRFLPVPFQRLIHMTTLMMENLQRV
jgi:hypothetical protein